MTHETEKELCTMSAAALSDDRLQKTTLRELVAIHNEHADEPVSRFSSRAVALRRVREVMAQARRHPSRLPVDRFLRALRRGEIEVGALAKSLRVTQRDVRSAIDRLRRQGHRIERLAPCTFGL